MLLQSLVRFVVVDGHVDVLIRAPDIEKIVEDLRLENNSLREMFETFTDCEYPFCQV